VTIPAELGFHVVEYGVNRGKLIHGPRLPVIGWWVFEEGEPLPIFLGKSALGWDNALVICPGGQCLDAEIGWYESFEGSGSTRPSQILRFTKPRSRNQAEVKVK
jgi:hypothetical protein